MTEELLTVRECAKLFKVTERTIRRWIEIGELPSRKIVGTIRIRRQDAEKLCEKEDR